jgi:hypothetical protein
MDLKNDSRNKTLPFGEAQSKVRNIPFVIASCHNATVEFSFIRRWDVSINSEQQVKGIKACFTGKYYK